MLVRKISPEKLKLCGGFFSLISISKHCLVSRYLRNETNRMLNFKFNLENTKTLFFFFSHNDPFELIIGHVKYCDISYYGVSCF